MSISFKHTIIHVLDLGMDMPLFSTNLLYLDDETEAFLTKHIMKILESPASNPAFFKDSASLPDILSTPLDRDSFISFSKDMGEVFYKYMQEYGNLSSGDLILSYFNQDGSDYLGILKLNYKEEYTHFVDTNSEGVTTKIIKHKSIFPGTGKTLEEGIIVRVDDLTTLVLDTTKSKYLALLFDLDTNPSVKETIKAIESVATKVIEEHYDNPVNALVELKNNISDSISHTQTIPVHQIMEQTFGADEIVFESCINKMSEQGLSDVNLEVTDPKISNKFSSQKIQTDTGIEIKFPSNIFKNPEFIEIINNPDGTLAIMIKNISSITNK